MVMMMMIMMIERRISRGDVSEEKGVGSLMRKGIETPRPTLAVIHVHGTEYWLTVMERGSVWLESLQLRNPSCEDVSQSSWLFTPISTWPAKRNIRFVRRVRHSECHVVNESYGDTHEMCNPMNGVPQYSATMAQWHLLLYSLAIRG